MSYEKRIPVVKAVRAFIKTCPLLQEDSSGKIKLGVDYLDSDTTSYSLEEVPENPILKKYLDGSAVKQATFLFCSREPYSPELQQQIDNSGFYEDFASWLEKCNREDSLPVLNKNRESRSIEAITCGYTFMTDSDKAVYQIQINFKYFEGVD